ncbi:MAG: class B sortase [Oscillospiraceae bacterium]
MALADEVYQSQHYKEKEKKKKSFSEAFIPHKGDSRKEIFSKVFSLFAIAVLIACIVILVIYFYHQFEAKQNNAKLNVIYNSASNTSSSVSDNTNNQNTIAIEDVPEAERPPLVKSEAAEEMLAINPDYVGYIYIPDVLGEPIVQRDDSYYLKHNFYDQVRSVGTVFADPRNIVNDYSDKQSSNIILYGHNNRDGSMFGNLDYYKWDPKYWLKNPFIYYDNYYENYTYVIISSFVINTLPEHDDGNLFDYINYINFKDSGKYTFENYKNEITVRSQFITGIDFDENDKYLTLSTCAYEWDEARHVIIARRLRPGETTDNIDTTGFYVNQNPKWPAIYYKFNGGSYTE